MSGPKSLFENWGKFNPRLFLTCLTSNCLECPSVLFSKKLIITLKPWIFSTLLPSHLDCTVWFRFEHVCRRSYLPMSDAPIADTLAVAHDLVSTTSCEGQEMIRRVIENGKFPQIVPPDFTLADKILNISKHLLWEQAIQRWLTEYGSTFFITTSNTRRQSLWVRQTNNHSKGRSDDFKAAEDMALSQPSVPATGAPRKTRGGWVLLVFAQDYSFLLIWEQVWLCLWSPNSFPISQQVHRECCHWACFWNCQTYTKQWPCKPTRPFYQVEVQISQTRQGIWQWKTPWHYAHSRMAWKDGWGGIPQFVDEIWDNGGCKSTNCQTQFEQWHLSHPSMLPHAYDPCTMGRELKCACRW